MIDFIRIKAMVKAETSKGGADHFLNLIGWGVFILLCCLGIAAIIYAAGL